MNVVIYAGVYEPEVGGTITIPRLLTQALQNMGHQVSIITETHDASSTNTNVIRQPSLLKRLSLYRNADLIIIIGFALRPLIQAIVSGRRPIISHQEFTRSTLTGYIRQLIAALGRNVACSHAVKSKMIIPAYVIPNMYDDDLFLRIPRTQPSRDLIFVGRVVPDKGVDIILKAMPIVIQSCPSVSLTIIGSGSELGTLQEAANQLAINRHIHWMGSLAPHFVAAELRQHRIILVPSRWEEPFGIVALEGLASGCIPIVARSGGLPEAIDCHGVVVEKNNPEKLAQAIISILNNDTEQQANQNSVANHLSRHTKAAIALRYTAL